jgi:hypothetical protein
LISEMIHQGIQKGMSKPQISKYILRQFKRSELNESF